MFTALVGERVMRFALRLHEIERHADRLFVFGGLVREGKVICGVECDERGVQCIGNRVG